MLQTGKLRIHLPRPMRFLTNNFLSDFKLINLLSLYIVINGVNSKGYD